MSQPRFEVRIKTEDIGRLNESGASIEAYSLEVSQNLLSALIEVSVPARWIGSFGQKERMLISVPVK